MAPTYREGPQLDEILLTAINQAENEVSITFNSTFFNGPFAIGNIFYKKKQDVLKSEYHLSLNKLMETIMRTEVKFPPNCVKKDMDLIMV